jgi:hypothetical protein
MNLQSIAGGASDARAAYKSAVAKIRAALTGIGQIDDDRADLLQMGAVADVLVSLFGPDAESRICHIAAEMRDIRRFDDLDRAAAKADAERAKDG